MTNENVGRMIREFAREQHIRGIAGELALRNWESLAAQVYADAPDADLATQWQPIETAPPTGGHGLHVLLYVPAYGYCPLVVEGWVNDAHPGSPWVAHNGGQIQPTHWMPLPDPPKP